MAYDLDVKVIVDRKSSVKLREQILTQLRQAIVDGVLMPDDPLPSTRELARCLGVSRTTIMGCYLELDGEGWITTAHGAGTFVARRDVAAATPVALPPRQAEPIGGRIYDFRPGGIDPAIIGATDWHALWRHASPSSTTASPVGTLELRCALATYLGSARGLPCQPEEIIVCAGTAEAVALVCMSLRWGGRTVAVEDPGYPAIRTVLNRMDVNVVSVDVGDDHDFSVRLTEFDDLAGAYLTPSHQYPLGHRLSVGERQQIIDWADRTGTVVVEDDYDGEFCFGMAPSTSMAGMQPLSNVVFIGTLSKVLDPGLRLAYLRVPPHLIARVSSAREDLGSTVATPVQEGVAAFIQSGEMSRHIARARRRYADRRRVLLRELSALPFVHNMIGIDAGLHVVVQLTPGIDAARVVRVARRRGVELVDLNDLRAQVVANQPALVLGYSRHTASDIRAAMRILHDCAPEFTTA